MVCEQDGLRRLTETKDLEPEPESPFLDEAAYDLPTREEAWDSYEAEPELQSETPFVSALTPGEQGYAESAAEGGLAGEIEPESLEAPVREPEEEAEEEEGDFERQLPPAPPPPRCGFDGPNGIFVTEADLRSAVVNAALDERTKWWDSTSRTLQKEDDNKRFGDLIGYWLAGLGGRIHPGKLQAVQQAALDPSITYTNLRDATLNAARRRFGVEDKKVEDWSDEVYKQSAVEDLARANFQPADAAWKAANAAWKAADAAVKRAEARLRDARGQSRSAAQAALDTERATLRTATTALSAARQDRDAKKKDLDEATRARATAQEKHRRARGARKPLENPASAWKLVDRQKARKALLAKAAGTDSQNIDDIVDEALLAAHRSRANVEAWSAVFVVSCVREAAIGRKLEAMDSSGAHVGKDLLLKASRKHAVYVIEARERKLRGDGGTYYAFEPRDHKVEIGDIICTDRTNFISKPVSLEKLVTGRELHCDIVTSIKSANGQAFAETLGGNVRHTVRHRRYPLDSGGLLAVSAAQLFAQENDVGTFPPFETLSPAPTTMLAPRSTRRILALLSLVCKPAPAPTAKRAPTGRERFLSLSLEDLESPFLDVEIFPVDRQTEFDSGPERLAEESPFAGALEERLGSFEENQLEEEEAPDELESREDLGAEEDWEELEEEQPPPETDEFEQEELEGLDREAAEEADEEGREFEGGDVPTRHSFHNCSASERSAIEVAATRALNAVRLAETFVGSAYGRPDNLSKTTRDLLMRHFHSTSRPHLRNVLVRLMRIRRAFEGGIDFKCEKQCAADATGMYCGYTNVSQWFGGFGDIHVCFDAAAHHCHFTRTLTPQQRMVVIIHEVAHRYVGIEDRAYFLAQPAKYAKLSAGDALDNADSYAFFAVQMFEVLGPPAAFSEAKDNSYTEEDLVEETQEDLGNEAEEYAEEEDSKETDDLLAQERESGEASTLPLAEDQDIVEYSVRDLLYEGGDIEEEVAGFTAPDLGEVDEYEAVGSEECEVEDYEEQLELEEEARDLAPANTIDEATAQPAFPKGVRDRVGPLLNAKLTGEASKWNAANHPGRSGIGSAILRARLEHYLSFDAIQQAMRDSTELRSLTGDPDAVVAIAAHQFQQKIYASPGGHDGKIGEGTLDALGFVRHRGDLLNRIDTGNEKFHVKGKSKAFERLQQVYAADKNAFRDLGADVSPHTWYRLFVNAPFLGLPFNRGIHVELMRRLRRAEVWLLGRPAYAGMTPVELGKLLNIDEDHAGGRAKNNSSMHTLGLAVDIRYTKNPWVAGQADAPTRNKDFQEVTRNVSRLLEGKDETITPQWLSSLAADPGRTTESAYLEILTRQTNLQKYLSFEHHRDLLKSAIQTRIVGADGNRFLKPGEDVDAAADRWRGIIKSDRAKLQHAFGRKREPAAGFMNLHRDLVVALRDHGCLAWGAIDLGRKQSGDMMHFDCRTTGVGWKLALDAQRTAGANHLCGSKAQQKHPTPGPAAGPSPVTPFRGGQLWSFTARILPLRVAVFCPKAAALLKQVDVLVYAHGLLAPCPPVPKAPPEDLVTKEPFELGKLIDASSREIILVVPLLNWEPKDRHHALGRPANLNALVAEVLVELGRVQKTAVPSLRRLILGGHSRAYGFLDPLAGAHADPRMQQGALAKLSHVWAFDTLYAGSVKHWLDWLNRNVRLQVEMFYRPGSPTAKVGDEFYKRRGARLRVTKASEGHCDVPATRLPALLKLPAPSRNPFDAESESPFLDEAAYVLQSRDSGLVEEEGSESEFEPEALDAPVAEAEEETEEEAGEFEEGDVLDELDQNADAGIADYPLHDVEELEAAVLSKFLGALDKEELSDEFIDEQTLGEGETQLPPEKLAPFQIRGGLYSPTWRKKELSADGIILTSSKTGNEEKGLANRSPFPIKITKEIAQLEGGRFNRWVQKYNAFTIYFEEVLRQIGRLRDLLRVRL